MRAMSRLFRVILAVLLASSPSHVIYAQTTYPTKFSPEIAARADVKQALAFIDRRFDAQVAEWIHLTEIPGTSGHEQKRAETMKVVRVSLAREIVGEIRDVGAFADVRDVCLAFRIQRDLC